jgi:hypothetical protein
MTLFKKQSTRTYYRHKANAKLESVAEAAAASKEVIRLKTQIKNAKAKQKLKDAKFAAPSTHAGRHPRTIRSSFTHPIGPSQDPLPPCANVFAIQQGAPPPPQCRRSVDWCSKKKRRPANMLGFSRRFIGNLYSVRRQRHKKMVRPARITEWRTVSLAFSHVSKEGVQGVRYSTTVI